jgi:hypothetical protein
MKKQILLVIIIVIVNAVSGCDKKSVSEGNTVESSFFASSSKNLLEDAIDPFTGSREKWSEFTDNGGLNHVNDFYGMSVEGITVQWKDNISLRLAVMNVSKAMAPKKIREALNRACKTNESDWQKEDGALTRGEVHNGKIRCDYITNDGSRTMEVAITIEDIPS